MLTKRHLIPADAAALVFPRSGRTLPAARYDKRSMWMRGSTVKPAGLTLQRQPWGCRRASCASCRIGTRIEYG